MHCKCGICGYFLESCIINQQWEFRLRLVGLEIDLQRPLPYPCFPAWHQEWRKHDAGGPREPLKIGDFCITPCFSSQKNQVLKRLAQIVGWKAGSYKTETVQISETQHRKNIVAEKGWEKECVGFLQPGGCWSCFFLGVVIKSSNFGTKPGCFTGARSGGWIEWKTWIRGSHEPNGPPKKTEEQIISVSMQ